jgi:hypothetical protein
MVGHDVGAWTVLMKWLFTSPQQNLGYVFQVERDLFCNALYHLIKVGAGPETAPCRGENSGLQMGECSVPISRRTSTS